MSALEPLSLALHREVALLPWVPLGTGVAVGLADAAVIAGHTMGYQDVARYRCCWPRPADG